MKERLRNKYIRTAKEGVRKEESEREKGWMEKTTITTQYYKFFLLFIKISWEFFWLTYYIFFFLLGTSDGQHTITITRIHYSFFPLLLFFFHLSSSSSTLSIYSLAHATHTFSLQLSYFSFFFSFSVTRRGTVFFSSCLFASSFLSAFLLNQWKIYWILDFKLLLPFGCVFWEF